ncbi:MAG: CCA tRNA nucleotidyltransferase [Lachnospiraceae bacterium]|nr:CCA tRNA nucleotidyltransferase [Lachnospiraceae bacterium]
MQILLPEKVKQIIATLTAAGYEAYAVGGCVRDSILGRVPDDWDITTSAKPHEVKKLFARTIDTGIEHGTVTVMLQKEGFEVTTYRIDGEYEDSRHPKEVIFTPNLIEDLKRRDFTINAMAYNDAEGMVDAFDGMGDIDRKLIRAVGIAKDRFTEDALRIMRAIRFSAQLGYSIEENTKQAIMELAPNLRNISAERIQVELVKLVTSRHPEQLRDAYETCVTKVILPEFDQAMQTEQNNPHHCYSVGEHTLVAMQKVRADKVLRLTMLFHDLGKPEMLTVDEEGIAHFHGHPLASEQIAKTVLRRLKFDNDTIDKVTRLVKLHDYKPDLTAKSIRRAIRKVGEDIFPLWIEVQKADVAAQSDYKRKEKLERIAQIERIYNKILTDADCVSLKTLAVTGRDLIDAGMTPGKEIGITLNHLLEIVLDTPERNTKEYLMSVVFQK